MNRVLLIEPDYRSTFPPLGLLRLSTYHKSRGDKVTFARGCIEQLRRANWHRVYISSLFTWELPKTVDTIRYYSKSVRDPANLVVGGIGATLMPQFIETRVPCTVLTGPLDRKGRLGPGMPSLECYIPDYSLLDSAGYQYKPEDSYFCRTTKGCPRQCRFCAVRNLEPKFATNPRWRRDIKESIRAHGERQHLVLLDSNVLAHPEAEEIVAHIGHEGFESGATRNGRRRKVDFNQGIDARLITRKIARTLGTISLSPVRLAFDHDSVEGRYRRAIQELADVGFWRFMTYIMFNFNDTPRSLYRRMKANVELSQRLGIEVAGFPMRFIPIDDVSRGYVSAGWKWRYLRGIQCVLLATHGIVSPNRKFFVGAFGNSFDEFLEILSMPDRYIIHREKYRHNEAADWLRRFRKLSTASRNELLDILRDLNATRDKRAVIRKHRGFMHLLEHYYPGGDS